jgi:hypothetical protein
MQALCRAALLSTLTLLTVFPSTGSGAAEVLITPEEALLPPPKGAVGVDRRGVTRGPKVELLSPTQMESPSKFQLKFQSFGGSTIDIGSVRVIYLRTPNVDLTPRVKSFVQPTGVDMGDVVLPPGEHMLRVDIKDSNGRAGSNSFLLKVAR